MMRRASSTAAINASQSDMPPPHQPQHSPALESARTIILSPRSVERDGTVAYPGTAPLLRNVSGWKAATICRQARQRENVFGSHESHGLSWPRDRHRLEAMVLEIRNKLLRLIPVKERLRILRSAELIELRPRQVL